MSTRNLLIAMVLVLYCVSCRGTFDEENVVQVPQDITTFISASTPDATRTHLGETDGSYIPVYWSEGDMLNVNGVNSSPLNIDGNEQLTRATFEVKNVSLPYCALYPDEIYVASKENNSVVTIDIPVEQSYVENSFAEGAAILYGYAPEQDNIVFNNLCGAVRLSLKGEGLTVSRIQVVSDGTGIAGLFDLDIESGVLTAVDAANAITLVMPEGGIALSDTPRDFIIALPAGYYPDGFTIKIIEASSKKTMNCSWTRMNASDAVGSGVTLAPGYMADFGEIEYIPTHREIVSGDDFIEFALAADGAAEVGTASGGAEGNYDDWISPDGEVELCADITVPEICWYSDATLRSGVITNWSGVFDGNGHTITVSNSCSPIFYNLYEGGVVKNLTLDGMMNTMKSGGQSTPGCCPLVGYMYGGEVSSCVNSVDISISVCANTAMAGIARQIKAGKITDCRNEGTMSYRVDSQTSSINAYVGGIVAIVGDIVNETGMIDNIVIERCNNEGNISVSVGTKISSAYSVNYAAFGGIAAWVYGGTAETYATLSDCENHGEVSVEYPQTNVVGNSASSAGGIVGWSYRFSSLTNSGQLFAFPLGGESTTAYDGFFVKIDKCRNYGSIYNRTTAAGGSNSNRSRGVAGGIVGTLFGQVENHAQMHECENYGTVAGGTSYSRSYCHITAGGLVGYGGFTDISNCTVKAQIGDGTNPMFSAGGVFGVLINKFSIVGSSVFADIRHVNQDWEYYGCFIGAAGSMISRDMPSANAYLSGSTISDSKIGGHVYCRTTANTVNKDITAADYMNYCFCANDASVDLIKNNIAVSGISYWNGE